MTILIMKKVTYKNSPVHKHCRVTNNTEGTASWFLTSCLQFSTRSGLITVHLKNITSATYHMKNTPPVTFQLFRPCDSKSVNQRLAVRIHFLTEVSARMNHMNLLQAGRNKCFAQKCVDVWWTVEIHKSKERLWERKKLWLVFFKM